MATFTHLEHRHPDTSLVNAAELSRLLGVSRAAVSQCVREEHGRLDIFLNSNGEKRFHPTLSVAQWSERRAVKMVSTPTRGQAAAGLDGQAAQAVAHRPLVSPNHPHRPGLPIPPSPQDVEGDRRELAQSRAERERHQARLVQLKVMEKEGDLLDKSVFFQRAYSLAASIKDKMNGIPPQVSPAIVSAVEEALVSGGLPAEQARDLVTRCNLSHTVREAIRAGVTGALRDLTATPLEELING